MINVVQSRALKLKYIFKIWQKSLNEKIKFEILKNEFTVQNLLYYNSTLPIEYVALPPQSTTMSESLLRLNF